jgi:NAD(P)H-dependent FMN reductase
MITLFSCTNRPENLTKHVANTYFKRLSLKHEKVLFFSFENLPQNLLFHNEVLGSVNLELDNIYQKYIVQSDKLVFVMPEYNGSFPGVLKLFIDSCPPRHFKGKKTSFVGVATGRAGNLRGMDHLTHVMHHLGAYVMPFQLPVSRVQHLLNSNFEITDEETLKAIDRHIDSFLKF